MGSVSVPPSGGGGSKTYYLYLGTGTSFNVQNAIMSSTDRNIKSIDYTKLTNDNFIIEPTSGFSYSGSGESERFEPGWTGSSTNISRMGPSKSYSASTGVLTAKYNWYGGASYRVCPQYKGGSVSCKAYLIYTED